MRHRRKTTKVLVEEFDKTQLVEEELVDKISLWMLRIIINLGGAREFLDSDNRFQRDSIACFLGADKYVDMDSSDFKRSEVLAILKNNHTKLEKRKRFTSSKILTKNIKQISKLMTLNSYEEQILEFFILINQYDVLVETADLLGSNLNSTQAKKVISTTLNIPIKNLNDAFKSSSKLSKSSIVTINKSSTYALGNKIEIISDSFADDMLNLDEDISVMIKDAVRPCDKGSLQLKDYEHISKDIDIVIPYVTGGPQICRKYLHKVLLYGVCSQITADFSSAA